MDFSKGKYFLANPSLNQISVLNKKGEEEKIIGRKGQGPSEFGINSHSTISIMDERIIVSDNGGVRLQILDKDGSFIKQYKFMTEVPVLPALRFFPLSEDEIGIYGYSIKEMKAEGISMVHKFTVFDIEKGSNREIYSGSYGTIDPKALKSVNPFSGFPFPSVTNNLIFQADREKYKIEIFGSEGKKVDEIKRESKAISISEELKRYFSEKEEFKRTKVMSQGDD